VTEEGNVNFKENQKHRNANTPPEGVPTLTQWWGFARSYEPESYAGGSLLLVGSPMPDRSKVMTQTKRDTLALQVGGR